MSNKIFLDTTFTNNVDQRFSQNKQISPLSFLFDNVESSPLLQKGPLSKIYF